MKLRALAIVGALALFHCGDEGSLERVRFTARSASGAPAARPLVVRTPLGWEVTLRTAAVSVGALYCRTTPPSAGTSSSEEGRVVAQVLSGFTVDALNADAVEVPGGGNAVTETSRSCELRLLDATSGPVSEGGSRTALARVAGTARRGAEVIEFDGVLDAPVDRSRPAYQSVADRRIYGIAVEFTPGEGGALTLRVDPTHWLDEVRFEALPLRSEGSSTHTFDDALARAQLRAGVAVPSSVRVEFTQPSMN